MKSRFTIRTSPSVPPRPARRLAAGGLLGATLLLSLTLAAPAQAQEQVRVGLEHSQSLQGPWLPVDLKRAPDDGAGNPVFAADGQGFFRARVDRFEGRASGIPLMEVPEDCRKLANRFVDNSRASVAEDPGEDGEWPQEAEFSPLVYLMHEVAADGSTAPAYLEFKVVRGTAIREERTGFIRSQPDDSLDRDLGYVVVSTREDDFPVVEFATEGKTICEELMAQSKGRAARVVRFGPTFAAAEDADGALVASKGAAPFKVDPRILDIDGMKWIGDDDEEIDIRPEGVTDLVADGYASYEEFKQDVATGRVYVEFRRIRAQRAKAEWDVLRGRSRQIVLTVGDVVTVFPDMFGRAGGDFLIVTETPGFLEAARSNTAGLNLSASLEGDGLLRVRDAAGREDAVHVTVVPARPRKAFGDVTKGTWYAANWAAQPKYHQYSDSEWCSLVGCGPVAWAILFAWFDRQWGVEWAFLGEPAGQKPPPDTTTTSRKLAVKSAYNDLHEYCDVICPWGSDEGATYPTDMTEGFISYTWISKITGQIKRKWDIDAITGGWPEKGALRCRDAIKSGYPAVVGLGYYWHYAVAYGYHYKTTDYGAAGKWTARYLKCNMGWGPGTSPRWYNMMSTFYAANVKIVKGPNG